jgi:hypothetical protein
MAGVVVLILHLEAGPTAGPLERWVAATRAQIAERHRAGFSEAGADDVRVVAGPPDDTPFGVRVRGLIEPPGASGVVVLGSGAVPLISSGERRRLVEVAASASPRAMANSRYSAEVAAVAANPQAELLVAGRSSARTLAWLEGGTASRTRAIVEERGMRSVPGGTERPRGQRPPRSVLGAALDRDGPESFGIQLVELCDAAVVDSRVLMAHRFGADERRWPRPEDRFASDLLLHERIADPWLRALTRSTLEAPIPIVLGGHTLVGPGLRLALRRR